VLLVCQAINRQALILSPDPMIAQYPVGVKDARAAYGEQRLKSLGWLRGRVVVLVWTERAAGPHLISCRYGDKHETQRYFNAFV